MFAASLFKHSSFILFMLMVGNFVIKLDNQMRTISSNPSDSGQSTVRKLPEELWFSLHGMPAV